MFKEFIAFDLLEGQPRARCCAPLRSRLQLSAALCDTDHLDNNE